MEDSRLKRKKMLRSLFISSIILVIVVFIVQFVFKTLLFLDVNKRVYNHRPGPCREVNGPVNGSEDVEMITNKNIAFISSCTFWLPKNPEKITCKGEIFKYDLLKIEYSAESVKIVGLEDVEFHPHGMSHFILDDGTVRLFVVSHTKQYKHSIVLLDYDEKKNLLRHVRTIRDEKFIRPNDIAATGSESFFISNDGGAQSQFTNTLESISGFYGGSVVHYDGSSSKYLLEKSLPNGVSLSEDQKTLFVSHFEQESIKVYKWNEQQRSLEEISVISTLSGCDNFYIDGNNVWTACHPILKDGLDHLSDAYNPKHIAPSQVLLAKFSDDFKSAKLVELLADDGNFITAASVAAGFDSNRQMLIGTVARKLYHCDINVPIDF